MRARTLVAVLTVTAVGVCAALSIRNVLSRRHHKQLDKQALSRWEDEGGPPPPPDDGAELSTAPA
jgi:hypothetical protein